MLKKSPTQWIPYARIHGSRRTSAHVSRAVRQSRPLGVKNEFDVVCVSSACDSVYTPYSPWYSSTLFYNGFYLNDDELSPPAFVKTRLEEIALSSRLIARTIVCWISVAAPGSLLEAARKNGWNAQGLDVSAGAVKHVRSLGFEVFEGELHDAAFPSATLRRGNGGGTVGALIDPQPLLHEVARVLVRVDCSGPRRRTPAGYRAACLV